MSLLYLHYLGEAVDVADIPVMLVVVYVEVRQVARGTTLPTGGATRCAEREEFVETQFTSWRDGMAAPPEHMDHDKSKQV